MVERRGVAHRAGIEEHQIGVVSRRDEPAARQPQSPRGAAGEVGDALLQAEDALLPDVVAEVAREGPPGPRVR